MDPNVEIAYTALGPRPKKQDRDDNAVMIALPAEIQTEVSLILFICPGPWALRKWIRGCLVQVSFHLSRAFHQLALSRVHVTLGFQSSKRGRCQPDLARLIKENGDLNLEDEQTWFRMTQDQEISFRGTAFAKVIDEERKMMGRDFDCEMKLMWSIHSRESAIRFCRLESSISMWGH